MYHQARHSTIQCTIVKSVENQVFEDIRTISKGHKHCLIQEIKLFYQQQHRQLQKERKKVQRLLNKWHLLPIQNVNYFAKQRRGREEKRVSGDGNTTKAQKGDRRLAWQTGKSSPPSRSNISVKTKIIINININFCLK